MDKVRQKAIEAVQNAREELASIQKATLTFESINVWWLKWFAYFQRAESLVGSAIIRGPFGQYVSGYEAETDVDILDIQRSGIVSLLDAAILQLDRLYIVKPILDELISKVKDTKLVMLLHEFNAVKDSSPNLAAMGFRTILTLLIQERAKQVKPHLLLATRDDLAVDRCINDALQEHIFPSGEEKLLKRFRDSGTKDIFDNVVHKPGASYLINKDDLSDAVTNLLNALLQTTVS
jgi:hypothetical protein